MIQLENWSIQLHLGQYKEPQLMGSSLSLCGKHNGKYIKSSKIVSLNLEDKIIQTQEGNYRLGKPSNGYINWLKLKKYPIRNLGHKEF